MLKDLVVPTTVTVAGATALYPRGISWRLHPGVNVVVGGTGLGKTTLLNSIAYALIGPFSPASSSKNSLIDSEYFKGRFGETGASIALDAVVGGQKLSVQRAPLADELVAASLDGTTYKARALAEELARTMGLATFEQYKVVVRSLLYADESQYLLSWDSKTQNEILNLLFDDAQRAQTATQSW